MSERVSFTSSSLVLRRSPEKIQALVLSDSKFQFYESRVGRQAAPCPKH